MLQIWHIWIVAAIALFIAEIYTPGFVLACFGAACIASGGASCFGAGIKIQILVFSVSTLVIFFGVRPFVLKYFYSSSSKTKTNIDALVGKIGLISEKIDPQINKGRVIVGGENWRGLSVDDSVIDKGKKIEVVKVDGAKLIVKQLPKGKEL